MDLHLAPLIKILVTGSGFIEGVWFSLIFMFCNVASVLRAMFSDALDGLIPIPKCIGNYTM
jgi:hypothetical protein